MPTLALDAAALEKLVSAAVAAPSIHNSQPWRFRFEPDTSTLEVRADRSRAVPAADPQGRALYISVGAAVLNLRVAARHLGWAPDVRLLPDPAEPDLLAAVRLDIAATAARAEDAALHLPDHAETSRLLHLTAEAERRNTTAPAQRAESRSWIRTSEVPPYGIPAAALGPQPRGGHLPMRDFSASHAAEHRGVRLLRSRAPHRRPHHRARHADGLAARRPRPGTRPARRHRPRRPRLAAAPGHGVALPALGDPRPAPPPRPRPDADPPRLRARRRPHAPPGRR
ncbi:hypothetical protein [Kitasatospora sp. NPDC054795]